MPDHEWHTIHVQFLSSQLAKYNSFKKKGGEYALHSNSFQYFSINIKSSKW